MPDTWNSRLRLPLGLLFAGAVDKEKRLLYLFVAGLMGVALVMTTSRGGIVSLVAEILFLDYRHRDLAKAE